MSPSVQSGTSSWVIKVVRLLGFCIYVAAFFLPAIREVATPGAGEPGVHLGWFCAWVTLVNTLSSSMWHSKDCLAILSGWINPLMLLYLIFLIWRKAVWPRRIVAGLVVAFMVGTWIYFYLVPLVPLIGHFMWIGGILMMLAGEVAGSRSAAVENGKA